jgi:hypothetical protein
MGAVVEFITVEVVLLEVILVITIVAGTKNVPLTLK